jgi:hypothetical protein
MSDRLNVPSRNFLERTKVKLAASISLAAVGVMLLGFCAFSAGQAASYQTMVRFRLLSTFVRGFAGSPGPATV